LSSIKSFFGGRRTVSSSNRQHPDLHFQTSTSPLHHDPRSSSARKAQNGSNDESHVFASAAAAAAVPQPPTSPRLMEQEAKFSSRTSSFADLRSRSPSPGQNERGTQAYDRSSRSSEQHHQHSQRSAHDPRSSKPSPTHANEPSHPSEKNQAKFQLHRHFYPPSSTSHQCPRKYWSREDRRAHRAAWNDYRRSRKRRFRAALIWSCSVGVAAVGVAYGVGGVVENW
jgi:hypothetical protein